jgi:hypothetical protein|tara:strand:- start:1170 stop:1361 length:192 start_codon:yes stop_codon:yes gene_type:complete
MKYQIKIDMDDKSLIELLTHMTLLNIGVHLGQVYDGDNGRKLAIPEAEKLEEFGFKTKIVTIK